MSAQLTLFQRPAPSPQPPAAPARTLARTSDPDTSKAAAAEIQSSVGARALAVLRLIVAHPECTGSELAKFNGDATNHEVCRRVSLLINANLIEVPYSRECTVTKRAARVYRPLCREADRA